MKRYVSSLVVVTVLMAGVATSAPRPVAAADLSMLDDSVREQIVLIIQEIIRRTAGDAMGDKMTDQMSDKMASGPVSELAFETNLAELDKGHYEGWLITTDDEKISTGKFAADDDLEFDIAADLGDIAKVAITIEPEGDTDDVPSGVVVLVGELGSDGEVELNFPVDFSAAAGTAILATPTNGSDSDETSGIWFLDLPNPSVSLELPELPDGWVYEGWAVHEGTPLTSGRFTDVAAADDFDGFSGPEDAPSYPGEDFLENAPEGTEFPIDLADGESKIVISVEPDIDGVDPTGDGPAQAKPLLTEIPEGQEDHVNIELALNPDSIPEGLAFLKK